MISNYFHLFVDIVTTNAIISSLVEPTNAVSVIESRSLIFIESIKSSSISAASSTIVFMTASATHDNIAMYTTVVSTISPTVRSRESKGDYIAMQTIIQCVVLFA